MPSESQIPIASQAASRRFASRLALFYGAIFGLLGAYLPFFPVWLKAVGIEASWIGIITAVPAVTRFTVLPFVTGLAERRQSLRNAIIITAFATALGLTVVGLACGLLVDVIAPEHLIWVIAAVAGLSALASLGLRPIDGLKKADVMQRGAGALLRDPGFLAIILASALIQGSHAAYYIFASIVWKQSGLGGLTIAGLWSLGVLAEIVLFALSPRFTRPYAVLVVIGALSAVARWLITAQEPPVAVLSAVQLAHGLSFGLTQVGTMGLLVRNVPFHVMARGQGYLAACGGIVASSASILSGVVFARYGQGVYYLMAAMALSGAVVMWLARHRLADQPHSAASGG